MKKTMKFLTMGMLFIGMTALTGCKKEDMSKYATKDDLNNYATNSDLDNSQAKVFKFSLLFEPGDTFKSYSGITGYESGDVVILFVEYETLGGTSYWTQAPVVINNSINIIPEFSENTGNMFVNTLRADGTSGSPWSSSFNLKCKAVLVKANGMKTHPDVDYSSYKEVAEAFNLE